MICHDSVEMGWSTLGDLCITDGKLIGCSYYQDSVGISVADLSVCKYCVLIKNSLLLVTVTCNYSKMFIAFLSYSALSLMGLVILIRLKREALLSQRLT